MKKKKPSRKKSSGQFAGPTKFEAIVRWNKMKLDTGSKPGSRRKGSGNQYVSKAYSSKSTQDSDAHVSGGRVESDRAKH
jgi:hypothetical protein